MKQLYATIDDHIKAYQSGAITISGDIEFSMYNTVRQITHYILSKYFKKTGNAEEHQAFRNIGNAIVDLEWRAKNIDRKPIEAHAIDGDHLFSLIVTCPRPVFPPRSFRDGSLHGERVRDPAGSEDVRYPDQRADHGRDDLTALFRLERQELSERPAARE
jgi:hypothetical protein